MATLKILKASVKKIKGVAYEGHNLDFEKVPVRVPHHYLLCEVKEGHPFPYVVLDLYVQGDICGSGWCPSEEGVAVWRGFTSPEEAEEKMGVDFVLRPKTEGTFECLLERDPEDPNKGWVIFEEDNEGAFETPWFIFSENGGDVYYPCGYVRLQGRGAFVRI